MLTYGATCHFIVPELDAGNQIIYQSTFTVPPGMKLDEIIRRGQEDNEPHCLVEGVRRVVDREVQLHFHRVVVAKRNDRLGRRARLAAEFLHRQNAQHNENHQRDTLRNRKRRLVLMSAPDRAAPALFGTTAQSARRNSDIAQRWPSPRKSIATSQASAWRTAHKSPPPIPPWK